MAVRHGYGKIAGTDALVFAYDTGDTVNSYKGEPAFNRATSLENWSAARSSITLTTEVEPPIKGAPVYILERTATNAGVLCRDADDSFGYTNNSDLGTVGDGTWKYSIWVKGHPSGDSSTAFTIDIGDLNGANTTVTPSTEWTKLETDDSAGLNNGAYKFFDFKIDGALNNKVYISAVIITTGNQSHPQWLPEKSTRSATQGLIDLTGNSTLDLTNVSFDSNAQMTFDGTDDKVTHDAVQFLSGSSYTLSQWQQLDANANTAWQAFCGDDRFVVGGSVNSGGYYMWHTNGRFWWYQSFDTPTYYGVISQTLSGGNIFDRMVGESPFSVDVTFEGSTNTMKIYINGELEATATPTWAPGLDRITFDKIGGSNNRRFTGNIPTQKLYNRALTADEVRNNHRHYKNRFNI